MWSAGCILAELLGKCVLFKGTDYVDQLKKIIGVLGLPKDTAFWDETTSDSVIEYIRNLRNADGCPPPSECIDFGALFPSCPPEGIDLLVALLQLDPKKRLCAESALSHPYVTDMRDPAEEMPCSVPFDFQSFETIQDQNKLRASIVDEVVAFKQRCKPSLESESDGVEDDDEGIHHGDPCYDDDMVDGSSNSEHFTCDTLLASSTTPRTSNRTDISTPSARLNSAASNLSRRRYTGGSISTPISTSAAEAHALALGAVQEGRNVPTIAQQDYESGMMVFDSKQIVEEPEDMDEDDIQAMHSDESIQIDYHRRLLDPSNTDRQKIERHLSRDW
jgi:mitogen-activated protein kinase 7